MLGVMSLVCDFCGDGISTAGMHRLRASLIVDAVRSFLGAGWASDAQLDNGTLIALAEDNGSAEVAQYLKNARPPQ